MQGDIVTASRWLGASIVLASGIIVGGLRQVRPSPVQSTEPSVASAQPAPLDPDVLKRSAEATIGESGPGFEVRGEVGRSQRISILGPIPTGAAPASCLDPPGEAEVWEKIARPKDVPSGPHETRRKNAHLVIEKIGEKVDPCKVYPLAGPCQLVHCHYKCSVTFDETSHVDQPVPFDHARRRVEVVYIDKDHLRRCDGPRDQSTSP